MKCFGNVLDMFGIWVDNFRNFGDMFGHMFLMLLNTVGNQLKTIKKISPKQHVKKRLKNYLRSSLFVGYLATRVYFGS